MAAINYINQSEPLLSNDIRQSMTSRQTKKRAVKKHIISLMHLEENDCYIGTNVTYRLSHQKILRYENVNIYENEEYKQFIKSYENRDTVFKTVLIYYGHPQYPSSKTKQKKQQDISIADDFVIELEQPHYSINTDDNEFFRRRNCQFIDTLFTTREMHWVQKQNRPALYVGSIDTTRRFDCNSLFVYISKNKVQKYLRNRMVNINHGHLGRTELLAEVKKFVQLWYEYTMLLWYINWSWDESWHPKEITYEKAINLGYYLLANVGVFTKEEDWFVGVKHTYVLYLFKKFLWNDCHRGIKSTYRRIATSRLEKETRYMFPKEFSKLKRVMFKEEFKSPGQEKKRTILERNKTIRSMHSQGKSVRQIAKEVGCSIFTVSRAINSQ